MLTQEHFTACRDHIAQSVTDASSANPQRPCPNCGMLCMLACGRHSNKWMWTHLYVSDCASDRTGMRNHFNSKEEAIDGEMFK